MIDTINMLFDTLNHQENNTYILISFLGVCLLGIFLRIIVCAGYQANYTLFKLSVKEYKAKTEIKNTKSGLMNKIIKDFIRSAEKNISTVDTPAIVRKYMVRLHFMGWSYSSMERFVTSLEQGIVIIAAAMAVVFYEYRFVYGLLTAASFILLRVLASIFDFKLVGEKLADEMTEYVDREIGQFYAGDSGSILLRFKTETAAVISKQSETLSEAVRQMGNDLTDMLKLSMQEIASSVEESVSRIAGYGEVLKKPLEDWKYALESAESLQVKLSGGLTGIEGATENLQTAAENLTNGLEGYSRMIMGQVDVLNEQMENLGSIAGHIEESNKLTEKSNEKFSRQLSFLEQNQAMLEKTFEQYELSMESLTKKMGDGFAGIVDFQMQSSYKVLNESLQQNIHKIININNELIQRMQQMFDAMLEQSRNETAAVLNMKEQLEISWKS